MAFFAARWAVYTSEEWQSPCIPAGGHALRKRVKRLGLQTNWVSLGMLTMHDCGACWYLQALHVSRQQHI